MRLICIPSRLFTIVLVLLMMFSHADLWAQKRQRTKSGKHENRNTNRASIEIPFGAGSISYDLEKGSYQVSLKYNWRILRAHTAFGDKDTLRSTTDGDRRHYQHVFKDAVGEGVLHTIEWKAHGLQFEQLFYTYPYKRYFVTQLKVRGSGVSTAYISPVAIDSIVITDAADLRALRVPFDNDMWVRFDAQPLATANFTSSEVTAIYDNGSRRGFILGSLEHSTWKTGIRISQYGPITVYGGFADSNATHDKIPHGKVSVNDTLCVSPKVFVGDYIDWRYGMEEYAAVNKLTEPPAIEPWKKATPMGWNSWGMMQTKLSIEKAKQVVDYFSDSLKGFRNEDNTLYIDLDSYWDNLVKGGLHGDVSQLKEFATYCKSKGLVPGIYWAPFADWGKYDRPFENSSYRYGDAWIKQQGKPVDLDGALALDPTHPGTQARMALHINKFKELGFEMIKIDFLGHAALESDRFYDPNVTTGMQAYKVGMEYLSKLIDNNMLTYAAISPTMATGRYVHMRRIACDAFSAIDNTEYTLNSTGYGWWQANLYQYLDADHVVFNKETPGANRARLASALVTGTLITGDDFSVAGAWRATAQALLQDSSLLGIIKQGVSFRPIEANTGRRAPELFIGTTSNNVYMAFFNYDREPKTFTFYWERFGIHFTRPHILTELISGRRLPISSPMNIVVPAGDVMLFRLK